MEGLTEDQQRTWHAMATIRQEAEQSGRLAHSHIKRWQDDLEDLSNHLHDHQLARDIELKAEQRRQNEELIKTVAAQKAQQEEQARIIEELKRTQMAWDNYVQKELPGRVMTTIQEHTAGTPSASDIESRIHQLIQENRPAPTPIPENMLTREAGDNLIKEALERQGAEQQRAVQEAIDRAAREARESSIGPSREEIQRMIDQARRRRRGSTSGPNNDPPNPNQAGQLGTTPSGEPFVVKVSLPDRPIHRHISEPWLYSANKSEDLKA